MVRISAIATCLWLASSLPVSAFAQTPASPAAATSADTPPAEEDDTDSVTVIGKLIPDRKEIYEFYQQLNSNDFCPNWLMTPKGYSCAEVTYDIFEATGKHLGKCNVPIFRLYDDQFGYLAVTYDKLDCTAGKPKGRNLTIVTLEELFNPRTKDGTVFRKVSVMGIDQARALCDVSEDLCTLHLFDRTGELSYCTLQMLWGIPPRGGVCANRR
jgi:hypothetical protein